MLFSEKLVKLYPTLFEESTREFGKKIFYPILYENAQYRVWLKRFIQHWAEPSPKFVGGIYLRSCPITTFIK